MRDTDKGILGLVLSTILLAPASVAAAAPEASVIDAVKAKDAKAVVTLLRNGANVDATAPDGATALHWATHFNDLPTADALIRAGANVRAVNYYGVAPIMLAAQNGNAALIEHLLKAGADPNAALPSGETPLMTAARTGTADAVIALLTGGATVDARERAKGQTALMWALAENHGDVARVLVEHGANANLASITGFTPLMWAARLGNLEAAQLLVSRGANINAAARDGVSALLVATIRSHIPVVTYLLDKGADVNDKRAGYTPLHFVAGKWEGVEAFFLRDAPGEWRYLRGIRPEDKPELITLLLAHGADPNARAGEAPPQYGSSLAIGGVRNAVANGGTPFTTAAMSADVDVMRRLLAAGADPTIRLSDGTTALHLAAGVTWMENETILTEADYLLAVRYLVDLGLDLDAVNGRGDTAMHVAIPARLVGVVDFLRERGANINMPNKAGATPLNVATSYNAAGGEHSNPEIIALLNKYGAVLGDVTPRRDRQK